jgi:hypothetical protein
MSQRDFGVFYVELQPTSQDNKYEFIFEIEGEEEDFNKWALDYMNRKVCIEPKTYDASLNVLRDNLNLQKSRRGL